MSTSSASWAHYVQDRAKVPIDSGFIEGSLNSSSLY
jgi:hypothetical protein